ncbi:MAG TPA: L,D-transpeptidase family protein [Candidatus Eisenbacteria bacterium]
MKLKLIRTLFLLLALTATPLGCGTGGPSAQEIDRSLRDRLAALGRGAASVRGERLLVPKSVARFYQARKATHAWNRTDQEQIVQSIQEIRKDGLNPSDYHLAAIERLHREREKGANPVLEADLDILLTDAVGGMIDHTRYGRVRPISLNPSWNVDPREGAPPLEGEMARVAGARSARDMIESAKPVHFIYRGLKRALAQLREIAAKGGWPTVPRGKAIRPGATDPRIPAVRARLAATGELKGRGTSTVYDPGLRKAVELFQARHRLDPNGIIDKDVIAAMNVSAAARADQVRVNLERSRWVLPGLGNEFLLVNLPAFKAYLIRGGRNVWEARTQIGEEGKQTPSFVAMMRTVVFNPDWTVPPMILRDEVIGGMKRGKNYIAQKGLVILDGNGREADPGSIDWSNASADDFPFTIKQPPGPDNALGRVKFLFPNPYSVYLHDTPSKTKFEAEKRTFSHGCIRLENALELAALVLSWDPGRIRGAVESGETVNVNLSHPIPVVIVYWTVSVGASGEIRYMRDIYNQDPPVLAALNGRRR